MRKKTTVYIDERLLAAAKVRAAASGRREYEVFEDALRRYLDLDLGDVLERIRSWEGRQPISEEEALRLARDELAAVRTARLGERVAEP